MQRRDWSYKDGYKPPWIIYCTTAIAPMIVEGAEIKPAGARRAPQDCVAVIIPNDQWSRSPQGEEEEEEDGWLAFMPSCQVFSAKSKAYEELDNWQSWCPETYEADESLDLCPDPKTMRMSPPKPPTPKKKKPQGDPPAQPPAPHKKTRGLPKLQHQQKHQQQLHKKTTHQPHNKKKRHQRPRHKKGKGQPRKKKRHQKEQPQKATQAHKKKGMQPQLPVGQKTTDPNGRRSGRPKWWSKPLRRSPNDSARYTW